MFSEWRSVNRLQANSINKHRDALFETIFVSEIFSYVNIIFSYWIVLVMAGGVLLPFFDTIHFLIHY